MELEKILNINKNTGNNLIDYIQSVVSVPNNEVI